MLKVAGRLDADTTGLLIVTSDGQLNHRLTSPKSHKEKEYLVRCQNPISDTDLSQLEQGVKIENDYLTLPAKAVRKDDVSFVLTIIEGKYHQVKQMCEAVGNVCIALHRMRVDRWTLEGIEEEKWEMLNFRF